MAAATGTGGSSPEVASRKGLARCRYVFYCGIFSEFGVLAHIIANGRQTADPIPFHVFRVCVLCLRFRPAECLGFASAAAAAAAAASVSLGAVLFVDSLNLLPRRNCFPAPLLLSLPI